MFIDGRKHKIDIVTQLAIFSFFRVEATYTGTAKVVFIKNTAYYDLGHYQSGSCHPPYTFTVLRKRLPALYMLLFLE